jgi:hypothetical protein
MRFSRDGTSNAKSSNEETYRKASGGDSHAETNSKTYRASIKVSNPQTYG